MNKKLIVTSISAALLLAPLLGLAAIDFTALTEPTPSTTVTVGDLLNDLFAFIWPIVVAFVIIMFILAGFLFITAQGDASKIAQGRTAVIAGVVGVIVIILAYVMIEIVQNSFPSLVS